MKKKTMAGLIAIIALVSVAMFVGCIDKPVDKAVEGEPGDYFPTSTGMKWVYQIEIGEVEPLNYKEISWPLGKREITYSTRGRFRPLLEETPPKTFLLEMRVKGPAAKQGPLEYEGVELEIEKDELGIFDEYAKQVFWSTTRGGRFMAQEVVTYSPYMPGAPTGSWGGWGQGDGYSMRLIFFGDEPGTRIGMGKEPQDALLFVGIDTQVPQDEGTPLLHFLRTVESSERKKGEEQSHLGKGFTEDMWFARGKGMVRLEQKVEGETSMTWSLIQFSK